MTSIAIIIAMSDYESLNNLPACTRDGAAIEEIIKLSGRFSDIFYINGQTNSTQIKKSLAEFIKKYHGQTLDEVIFYFSGHGDFAENEFFYLLSDYNPRHRNKTSLSVNEVDDMIRPLNPNLFVKIADACHSGKPYIKSRDEFDEYLKSGNSKFKNIYFMFSSQADQFSYQDDTISYFTDSILKSIIDHEADTIRYADVISYVSDDFRANSAQTPYFISQADFTEIFLPVSDVMRSAVSKYVKPADENSPEESTVADKTETLPKSSISEKIKQNALIYCSKDDAIAAYGKIPSFFRRDFLSADFKDIYDVEINNLDIKPPNSAQIGSWLEKNKDLYEYFATQTTTLETYQKRIPYNPMANPLIALRGGSTEDKFVDATRTVISGYKSTTEVPYECIRVKLVSLYPNITNECCYIAPVISRTQVRFFWSYVHFKYKDWDKQVFASTPEWSTDEAFLKDEEKQKAICDRILEGFSLFVEEALKAKWET